MTKEEILKMEQLQKEYLKTNKITYIAGGNIVKDKRAFNRTNKKILSELALSGRQLDKGYINEYSTK